MEAEIEGKNPAPFVLMQKPKAWEEYIEGLGRNRASFSWTQEQRRVRA